jgi:Metallo-peptidase family M12
MRLPPRGASGPRWREARGLRRMGAMLAAAGVASAAVLVCRPASAYVRYKTEGGSGFFWAVATVPITTYPDDFSEPTMSTDQVIGAVMGAASAWSFGQNPCTYLNLQVGVSTEPTPVPANDGHNTLVFRSNSWCGLAADGTCTTDYDPSALAVTTDTASKKSGQIVDSDIEINAADYTWADVIADPSLSNDQDLQNALTHEMGHLIGLDHTCYDPSSGLPQPYDDAGLPVPACPGSAAVQATTMYPSADPGDTQKRTLAPDDQAGVCGIYPVDDPPMVAGGCASCATVDGPVGGMELGGLGILAAVVVCARRARRVPRR